MRGVFSVTVLGLALLGCAQPEQNAAELSRLNYTTTCDARLPFFGYYRYSRDEMPQYVEPDARIAMANDGGWCAIHYQALMPNGGYTVARAEVAQPPVHGSAMVGTLDGKLRIAYRPEKSFVGNDGFEVRLLGPIPYTVPVRVTVGAARSAGS